MDNITHSLTGAITARFIESRPSSPQEKAAYRRTFFWLLVVSANIPDIDVLVGILGDPIFSLKAHRALTHSMLFAPLLALLPAGLFMLFSKVKNIRLLWIISLLGIVLHIFFDLVTSFGTQILNPFFDTRYALDWLFIIDPWFTLLLAATLIVARFLPARRSLVTAIGLIAAVAYIGTAAFNHGVALIKVTEAASKAGMSWSKVSVLPQPLSIFRWQGLVQTEQGVWRIFISITEDAPVRFRLFDHRVDEYAERAMGEEHVKWYLAFARHPWISTREESGKHIVEIRDLMFSIDENLMTALGWSERSLPFSLVCSYDSDGNLLEMMFDGKPVERDHRPEGTAEVGEADGQPTAALQLSGTGSSFHKRLVSSGRVYIDSFPSPVLGHSDCGRSQ
jgi:inner membrane protein